MKAVVKTKKGRGNIECKDSLVPKPARGEVLIKVISAGICGTDIKIMQDKTWYNSPVILGHEFAGMVCEVGEGVEDFCEGDRVVSETAQVVCGNCVYCKTARPLMCEKRLSIGYGVNGAFAEYIAVRAALLHLIPAAIGFDEAALCEPFAVALHGTWDTGEIMPTQTVLVIGPGAIGQLAAQAVLAKGANVILAGTPKDSERLRIAKESGVTHAIEELSLQRIQDITGEHGVDIVIDCSGAPQAINEGLRLLNAMGRFVQIGLTPASFELDYALVAGKEISVVGSFGHQWRNWEQALALMSAKKVDVSKLVTAHYSLDNWEQAFEKMQAQEGIKILLHPQMTRVEEPTRERS